MGLSGTKQTLVGDTPVADDSLSYRLLVEAVTDYAIYMLDPAGYVISWNAGAQRFKGYAAREIIGQHFSRFYTEEDRAQDLPARVLETAAREGKFESEGWRVRKDGTRFWAHVVIDPIRDPSGRLTGFAKVTRDLTERKTAQEALERTREALFQSQKMEAIGQLTGGLAHDFNNLLMAVLGSLELLRKRIPAQSQQLRLLDNAILGAKRGAILTKRMLAFARRQKMDVRPIDLPALVHEMTDLLTSTLGAGTEIRIRFPDALEKVMADDNQLELALLNLCVNARDAMKNGGRIVISGAEEPAGDMLPAGRYVRLSVSDNGEGMTPEVLARATEPFFTTKGVGRGTGLGLSMVHGMAEQMGGRLVIKSKLGEGTIAEIWLPVAADQQTQVAVSNAPPPSHIVAPLRVLAVDDDRLVLFNTTAMLEDMGHTVVEAGSGEEALEALCKESFDLVITDQLMPKMTGAELMRAIGQRWPHMPVILATGFGELPSDIKVKGPILNKPFTESDLTTVLKAVTP
jgi:PAS domain S-box-containing protein